MSSGDIFSCNRTKVRPSDILLEPQDHHLSFLGSGQGEGKVPRLGRKLGCAWPDLFQKPSAPVKGICSQESNRGGFVGCLRPLDSSSPPSLLGGEGPLRLWVFLPAPGLGLHMEPRTPDSRMLGSAGVAAHPTAPHPASVAPNLPQVSHTRSPEQRESSRGLRTATRSSISPGPKPDWWESGWGPALALRAWDHNCIHLRPN